MIEEQAQRLKWPIVVAVFVSDFGIQTIFVSAKEQVGHNGLQVAV